MVPWLQHVLVLALVALSLGVVLRGAMRALRGRGCAGGACGAGKCSNGAVPVKPGRQGESAAFISAQALSDRARARR